MSDEPGRRRRSMEDEDERRKLADGDDALQRDTPPAATAVETTTTTTTNTSSADSSQAASSVVTPSAKEPPSQQSLSPDGSLLTPRAPTSEVDSGTGAPLTLHASAPVDYFSVATAQFSSNAAASYTPAGEPPSHMHYHMVGGIVPSGNVVNPLPFVPHPGSSLQEKSTGSNLLWRRSTPKRSMTDLPNLPRSSTAIHHPAAVQAAVVSAAAQREQSNHGDYFPYSAEPLHETPALLPKESIPEQMVDRTPKTTGNTPAQTPSLFSPKAFRKAFTSSEDASPYPSPYLHPSQPQVPPKETHIANRDIDFHSGRKLVNQYEILDELGRGVHGKVKLGRNIETNETVAIKIVARFTKKRRLGKAYQSPEETVKREIAILKKIHHPNVVRMIEVIDDPELTKIYMVLEFCDLREINWRHRGSDEILIIENRRLDREARGMTDPSSVTYNEKQGERLIKAAAKRRDQARKRRPLGPKRAESEFWSLEFAADNTDEEDENVNTSTSAPLSRPISRVSSLAPEDSQSVVGHNDIDIATEEEIDPNDSQLQPSASSASISQGRAQPPLEPHAGAQAIDFQPIVPTPQGPLPKAQQHQQQAGAEDQLGDLSTSLWNRLSESLPSVSDAHESSRGRQSSVADSQVSHMSAIVEREFPEDLRFVPTMTITECRHAFRDAVLGLEYLHYQGVVHRDIKPANLLRTAENRVKISDFGVSYLGQPKRDNGGGEDSADVSEAESGVDAEEETELAKTVGTPAFYAPELCDLDYTVDGKKVTNLIDVWALGVTLYCMLFARTPFAGQSENEFVLMRQIASEPIFIPRKRLKAVDHRPSSRSSSLGPLFRAKNDKRLPHEYIHEEVDDELYDLLSRLLIKDPRNRITLSEVKHHPWVLKDIPNPFVWLEQTNPHRQHQGKKIETSKQDVAEAIMPLKIVERASSAVKKSVASVLATFTGRSRHRSKSTIQEGAPSSSGSSQASEPLSFPGVRRGSLKPSEPGTPASKALEHHDHPLAQSVTASPGALSINENPLERVPTAQTAISTDRPTMPERSSPAVTSSRTIRQSDINRSSRKDGNSAAPPPLTVSNLQSFLDPHGSSNLSAIFGGAGRSFLRSMRSRERAGSSRSGSPIQSPQSTSRSQSQAPDPHVDASLAIDSTAAEGKFNPPTAVRGRSPAYQPAKSHGSSPAVSRPPAFPPPKDPADASLHLSNVSSPRTSHKPSPVDLGGGASSHQAPFQMNSDDASEAEYRHTLETLDRRRALEDIMTKEAKDAREAHSSRPASAAMLDRCPPSPDDQYSEDRILPGSSSSTQASSHLVPMSSTSSEDRDLSHMSQTTLPSIASTESSIQHSHELAAMYSTKDSQDSDETTRGRYSPRRVLGRNYLELTPRPQPPTHTAEEDDGYAGDRDPGAGSDGDNDDDDDSSDGEFLIMSRVKSHKSHKSRKSSTQQ